jgi:hypothetical protein
MQKYVHNREASPQHAQNGQRGNPERLAIAANAKVSMKKGPTTRQAIQPQIPLGIPSRGFGNAQNSSATVQHVSLRRHFGQDNKIDLYDTDAESIDTTVNQSVIQIEDSQVKDPQYQQHGGVVDLGSEEADNDEEESEEGEEEDDAADDGEVDPENYALTQEDVDFLEREGQGKLSRTQAIEYLFRARSEGFRTVEGDSYPTTTDGEPTEWRREQEPTPDYQEANDSSPSPRRAGANGRQSLSRPSVHHRPYGGGAGHIVHNSNKLYKQGADLRVQQRSNAQRTQHLDQSFPPKAAPMQSSQAPSYSQASRDPDTRPHYQLALVQPQRTVPQQQPGPIHVMGHYPTPKEPPVPAKLHSSTCNNVVPVIQHPSPVEQAPVQDAIVRPHTDYDPEVLNAMTYDQLKNESFDTNPRLSGQPLSEDMRQKPLIERLEHVQKNFDLTKQSEFFQALPTDEWEDAGDWFLDQFSSIIQRTKQTRQQKRKLAQEFEDEVERRHKHVSKKRHEVEDAMQKMQAQGEGLVPRSPRPSKSPKPRKR